MDKDDPMSDERDNTGSSTDESRLTPAEAEHRLAQSAPAEFITLFRHGTLEVEYYRPRGVDRQKPHSRDEIYVVISGTGDFVRAGDRRPFQAGEVLFAPAGMPHHFDNFTDDFATWVFFYGPEGGERPGAE